MRTYFLSRKWITTLLLCSVGLSGCYNSAVNTEEDEAVALADELLRKSADTGWSTATAALYSQAQSSFQGLASKATFEPQAYALSSSRTISAMSTLADALARVDGTKKLSLSIEPSTSLDGSIEAKKPYTSIGDLEPTTEVYVEQEQVCHSPDSNANGINDFGDIAFVLDVWCHSGYDTFADYDCNGIVNFIDVSIAVDEFRSGESLDR